MGYYLMHKDRIIAKADSHEITEIENKDLCPVCINVGTPISRDVLDLTQEQNGGRK